MKYPTWRTLKIIMLREKTILYDFIYIKFQKMQTNLQYEEVDWQLPVEEEGRGEKKGVRDRLKCWE